MIVLACQKEQTRWRVPGSMVMRHLVRSAGRYVALPQSVLVNVAFVGDRTIRKLNGRYRGKRKTTDVLSFQYIKTKTSLEGDIIICVPQARRQARMIGHALQKEIQFLFVHGFLHLLGYDHERSTKEERHMFALQDRILGRK